MTFSDRVWKKIVELIAAGNYVETAAAAAGIARATFYNWVKKGEAGEPGYSEFVEELRKAEAQAETNNVEVVQQAARENWAAAAWFLERKFPRHWGKMTGVEVTGKDGGPLKVEDARRDLAEKMAKIIASIEKEEGNGEPSGEHGQPGT